MGVICLLNQPSRTRGGFFIQKVRRWAARLLLVLMLHLLLGNLAIELTSVDFGH